MCIRLPYPAWSSTLSQALHSDLSSDTSTIEKFSFRLSVSAKQRPFSRSVIIRPNLRLYDNNNEYQGCFAIPGSDVVRPLRSIKAVPLGPWTSQLPEQRP